MSARVIVVGAGPAGLVSAITLARYGIPTLVVEKRSGTSPFPRATGISLRSMELFRSWGIDEPIRAGDLNVIGSGFVCETLASPEGFPVPLGFASPEQSAIVSPSAPLAAPQDHLEPILLAHLRTYEHVDIRFGAEVVAIDQDGDGVTVTVRDDRGSERLRASHVVGADGAHSAVRSAVGIGMDGPDDLGSHFTVLFRAPLARVVGERRYGLYMVGHPEAAGVLLPTDRVDRWVYARQWNPATDAAFTEERLVHLIRTGAGVPELPVTIERTGSFTFAAQVAQRYREGRVFLVGDAAHRMTPRGGTGMNTAIHDGYDLGWKLAWVRRGWAGERLLDTYEPERRPVGLRNVARSAIEGPRDTSGDYLDDLGGRLPHRWLIRDGVAVSTLDLVGDGLTLLTGPSGRGWAEAAAEVDACVPIRVCGVDSETAELLAIGREGALLVRPDGQPVQAWKSVERYELGEAVRTLG